MKLKEIEPGMIIHCKVEEEADSLLEFLYTLGYSWSSGNSLLAENNYKINKDYTCYYLNEGKIISYGTFDYYRDVLGGQITNFTELEISRKLYQPEEMSTKEVLEWIAKYYYTDVWKAVFGSDGDIVDTISAISPEEIMKRITEWEEEQKNNKREPKFEWVDVCRIIEIQNDNKKRCVYEEQLASGNTAGEEKILVEAILKEYVLCHEGKFFATVEHLCKVVEDK